MAYQVLARKYRPANFHETVGQEHVLRALINALDNNRLHHAYLFTGTRGVGKTTIARILAKCLNCELGVTSKPCGQCPACKDIAEGRFIDLIEVDAASRTKVEDTRELLENIQYAPTAGRYKVYLIDEVHMLSNHSFNALLKTLEEPPPHVKFLLATTDPQKLPITVLSRCLQFSLKNMTQERIVDHLANVLKTESVQFDEKALWPLANAAQGSMRDALSLTDQAIAYGAGAIALDEVNAMLGTIDRGVVLSLVQALIEADPAKVMAEVDQLDPQAPDYNKLLLEIGLMLHRIAMLQILPEYPMASDLDREAIAALAQSATAEDVQLYYQIATHAKTDLAIAPDQKSGFQMILLRMLAFKPQGVIQADYMPPGADEKKLAPQIEPKTQSGVSAELANIETELAQVEEPTNSKGLASAQVQTQDPADIPPWEDPVLEQVAEVEGEKIVEAPVAETPVVEAPVAETPVVEAPVVEAPVVEAPVAEAPVVEASVVEAPVVEAPVVEAPVVEAPVVEAPVVEAPVVEAPVVEAPVVEAPVAEAPVAEAPVVEAPVVEAPVAEAPVVETPVVEAPVVEAPVAEAPVVEAPAAETGMDFDSDQSTDFNDSTANDVSRSDPVQQLHEAINAPLVHNNDEPKDLAPVDEPQITAVFTNLEQLTPDTFPRFALSLGLMGPTGSALRQMSLQSVQGNVVNLVLDEAQIPLFKRRQYEQLGEIFNQVFNQQIELNIDAGHPGEKTPAMLRVHLDRQRHIAAMQDLNQDANVQYLVNELGGTLREHTVESLVPEEL